MDWREVMDSDYYINEIEYESLGKAKEYLNIPITTIRWRILSKNPKYENYKYKDEN